MGSRTVNGREYQRLMKETNREFHTFEGLGDKRTAGKV
jgi:hypothetical protein